MIIVFTTLKMLTIAHLKQFSMESPPSEMLGRAPAVQEKYDSFMCKRENRGDFIATMKERIDRGVYYFTQNDFPYNTTADIEHWVCWYDNANDPSKIICDIQKKNNVITYWKNHSANMSIQEINHIHVFIQK